MAKLKIGVFGAARGRTMINVLLDHPDAELVAVCDKYEPLLKQVREKAEEHKLKIALYTDFEDFIRHDMDAVVLANYATEHATFGARLLRAGKHIMTEVLPCETLAQGVELVEAVEETGLVYAYAENYCYMDRTFEMWRRYERGDIGKVTYGEGEYIHDCTAIWPRITYGDRNHWRNLLHPFFYNTHSLGPLMTMTGERPAKVTGLMTGFSMEDYMKGLSGKAVGIEMVTTQNGAVFKSIHGGLVREPGSINYELYGTKGCMETQRYGDPYLNVWIENDKACQGNLESYFPQQWIDAEMARNFRGHGGADFYATHFWLQRILGRETGRYSIDVYRAMDMGLCGLMAYRSCAAGGVPMDVPDFRDPAQRDLYRHDNACTTPEVAGDQLQPRIPGVELPEVPQEAYDKIRDLWLADKNYEN